jgi:hypothetical protein
MNYVTQMEVGNAFMLGQVKWVDCKHVTQETGVKKCPILCYEIHGWPIEGMELQWGSKYRTPEYRIHSNTGQMNVW